MWILIVLMAGGSGGGSLTSVSGFVSEKTCMEAASVVVKNRPQPWVNITAVCAKA